MHLIEQTVHRLTTGMIQVPAGVDPGDFILSGGTAKRAIERRTSVPSVNGLIAEYLTQQSHVAGTYLATQTTHLRNFCRKLGSRADLPCDRIAHRDLEHFLQARLKERTADTVSKERFTLVKLFEWGVAYSYLETSPAASLPTIKSNADKKPFRTIAEIEGIQSQGGLDESETANLWDCLYLTPP